MRESAGWREGEGNTHAQGVATNIQVFDKSVFDEIKVAMDKKTERAA